MVRQNAGQQGAPLPPPEDLVDLDLLGIDLPPPGMEPNDGGIAPETFDVLARILSLGEQGGSSGSQFPQQSYSTKPLPPEPPARGSSSASRFHRDHGKRPYYAPSTVRQLAGFTRSLTGMFRVDGHKEGVPHGAVYHRRCMVGLMRTTTGMVLIDVIAMKILRFSLHLCRCLGHTKRAPITVRLLLRAQLAMSRRIMILITECALLCA